MTKLSNRLKKTFKLKFVSLFLFILSQVNRSSAEILRHNVNSEKSIHELHNICENVEKLSKNYESTVSQLLTPYNKLSYEIEFSDRLIDAEELLKTLQRFIILFKKYVALEAAGAAMHDMLKSTVSELISLLFSPDTQLYKLQAIMDRRKVLELRAAQLNISIPILN